MKKKECKIDKEKYYYIDDSYGFRKVTICLLLSGRNVARGMSVCSDDDIWEEKTGKQLANTFALRALKDRPNDEITNYKILKILINTRCPFTKKGEKNPELSWFERKLLFGWKKMKDYKFGKGLYFPTKKSSYTSNGMVLFNNCIDVSFGCIRTPIGQAGENISCGDVIAIDSKGLLVRG